MKLNKHTSYPWPDSWRFVSFPTETDAGAGFLSWEASIAEGDKIVATVTARTAVGNPSLGFPHIATIEEARATAELFIASPELQRSVCALLGLITLVAQRDDISSEARAALRTSHRMQEAMEALDKSGYKTEEADKAGAR